jgi:aminopeptidase YwaD
MAVCFADVVSRRSVLRALGMTPLGFLSPLEFLGGLKASPSLGSVSSPPVPLRALRAHTERLVAFKQKRAGSEGLSEVKGFLKERLEALGFSVQTDAFQFLAYRPKGDSLSIDGRDVLHETFAYSSGLVGRFPLVPLEGRPGLAPSLKGAIALAPIESFNEVSLAYQRAIHEGFVAIVFSHRGCPAYPFASSMGFAFDGLQKESIPSLSIPFDAITPLLERLGKGDVFADVMIESDTEPALGENLYAFSQKNPGSAPLMLLAAHFDTWFEGATDDCASVALLLELAGALKRAYPQANFGFLFLDAEEVGLLGAYRALQTLVIKNGFSIKAFLNLEQAVVSPKGFTSSTFSAPRLFFDAFSQTLFGASGGVPVPAFLRLAWSGGASLSNLVPFYNAGVPSLTTGPISVPAFNHTPADTLEKVTDEALTDAFRFMFGLAASVHEGGLGLGGGGLSVPEAPKMVFERKESGLEVHIVPAFLPGTIDALVLNIGFLPVSKPRLEPLGNGRYRLETLEPFEGNSDTFLFVRFLGPIPAEGWLKL